MRKTRYSEQKKKKRKWIFPFFAGVMVSVAVIMSSLFIFGQNRLISCKKYDEYRALKENYGKYAEIEHILHGHSYFKQQESLRDNAISHAILQTVDDPYSQYMNKKEYSSFEKKYLESYTGVGIIVKNGDDGRLFISRVLENSPADQAGIKEGDRLLRIDDESVGNLEEASKMLTGKDGTSATLSVERGNTVKKYSLKRTAVEDEGITYGISDKEHAVGYIRISVFHDGTAKAFKKALSSLEEDGCNKLIFDLRGNTGGIAEESFDAADMILPTCSMGTVKSRTGKKKWNSDEKHFKGNCVVLTDKDTASAAEIFASALKENHAAKIIGEKTYGKGLIQTVYNLKDGSIIKITTAEYYTPKGNKINGKGLLPNIQIDKGEDILEEGKKILLEEKGN